MEGSRRVKKEKQGVRKGRLEGKVGAKVRDCYHKEVKKSRIKA